MAIISALFFAAALIGLFLPGYTHEVLGLCFLAAVILHNAGSLGFYRDLAAGKLEGMRKKDAAVILAIAAAVILLILSGCVIFLNYFMGASILPSFDWMTLHIAAAIVSFLLMLLHMKQEWS